MRLIGFSDINIEKSKLLYFAKFMMNRSIQIFKILI